MTGQLVGLIFGIDRCPAMSARLRPIGNGSSFVDKSAKAGNTKLRIANDG